MVFEEDFLLNSDIIAAKFMVEHFSYDFGVLIIKNPDSFFEVITKQPLIRYEESVKDNIYMSSLLKLIQNSSDSKFKIIEIDDETMSATNYKMSDLILIHGCKTDNQMDLLSFYISFTSMLDLEKITSFFRYRKKKFLLFSVIVQKENTNFYIRKLYNLWVINSPLVEKKQFMMLGQAIFWVLKQGYVIRFLNYAKVKNVKEEQLWKKGELEEMENYRINVESISTKESFYFGKVNMKKIVGDFFKKRNGKCTCELCEGFVTSGNEFNSFKELLA